MIDENELIGIVLAANNFESLIAEMTRESGFTLTGDRELAVLFNESLNELTKALAPYRDFVRTVSAVV